MADMTPKWKHRNYKIEIGFKAAGTARTEVTFEHRHFGRHGSGSAEYRAALASSEGWEYILDCYLKTLIGDNQ